MVAYESFIEYNKEGYKGKSPPIFEVASVAYLLFINLKPLRTVALYQL